MSTVKSPNQQELAALITDLSLTNQFPSRRA